MKKIVITLILGSGILSVACSQVKWEHISSKTDNLEVPNSGKQQTSCAVADFDNDGINDFCISERTSAPGLVWYRKTSGGWKKYVVEDAICFIESGLQNGTGKKIPAKAGTK